MSPTSFPSQINDYYLTPAIAWARKYRVIFDIFSQNPHPINPSLDPIGSTFQIYSKYLLLTIATTAIWAQTIITSHRHHCNLFLTQFSPCYSLCYSPFSLEHPGWSELKSGLATTLLQVAFPRWFFKALPKQAGHFSDFSPTNLRPPLTPLQPQWLHALPWAHKTCCICSCAQNITSYSHLPQFSQGSLVSFRFSSMSFVSKPFL